MDRIMQFHLIILFDANGLNTHSIQLKILLTWFLGPLKVKRDTLLASLKTALVL
jgi:hypothetical protein